MKNVKIAGTNYNNVPSIDIPLQTSGVATFYDVSDTTAEAADVATGKYFYTAVGVRTAGTSSGGGGVTIERLNVTTNGTYTAPTGTAYSPVTVNVASITFQWASQVHIETIEANSITNSTNAKAYFDSRYSYNYAILLSPLTVNNQVVMMGVNNSRWRNNSISNLTIGTNYDAKLVEGTQYLILKK